MPGTNFELNFRRPGREVKINLRIFEFKKTKNENIYPPVIDNPVWMRIK
jgi:hypothetical protein